MLPQFEGARTIRHAIVLGCGRSGTSIFGELFHQLDGYTYFCEPPFQELAALDYSTPIAVKVPKESPGFQNSPGLSFPLQSLQQIIPPPLQVFWIVRHPLDAICSLRPGISQDWGHHPKPPDWRSWQSRPLVEQCAHHWAYINSVGFEQVCDFAHVVYFEDMLCEPVRFANAICRHVGLNADRNRSDLQNWAARVQNSNNAKFIEAECSRHYSRPDHNVRIGRWKENLDQIDVQQVSSIVGKTAEQFHYRLDDVKRTSRDHS